MTITKTSAKHRYLAHLAGKLLIITIIICIFAPLCYCGEQEGTETSKSKLNFIDKGRGVTYSREKDEPPAIVPTHCGEIYVKSYHREPEIPAIEALLKTSAGKAISTLQRDFLKTGRAISVPDIKKNRPTGKLGFRHNTSRIFYRLFAVSEDDAKKMAEAFVEVFLEQNNAALKPFLDEYLNKHHDELEKYQKLVAKHKTQKSEKEQEYETLRTEYKELKEKGYYQSDDQALKAILELNATLHTSIIELDGMNAKRAAIEQHRDRISQKVETQNKTDRKTVNWEPILLNLEQKYIDVMIDFDAARARRESAQKLREQAQDFVKKTSKLGDLADEISKLRGGSQLSANRLKEIEHLLDNPTDDMLPLKIYENRVTIRHPVSVRTNE